ncbi:MAG: TlpA family protein disulfide reductase [Verrucomicrobiales bacterium]|nr:TlpA family protein disulfide reductase [Verrucomicrobiales bacterium]MCP5558221.1 TlpA family protein disulfide reductase [Verrucomicrobiaceae bacterium]
MHRHKIILICIGLLLSYGTTMKAQGPTGLAVEIRGIIDEYENSVRANTLKIINATTEEEKARYRSTIPSAGPYATRMLTLLDAHPEDPQSVSGVVWLVTQCASFPEGQTALQLLATRYAKTAGTATAVRRLEFYPFDTVRPILENIRDQNPNVAEKAAAIHTLGTHHFHRYEAAATPEEAATEKALAEESYQRIITEFADVAIDGFKLADQASSMLFEIANLSPGAEAPDIVGSDDKDISFKLSDYRGQTVLLVFWGDWCHGCHGVLPMIADLQKRFASQHFTVLGVNTDVTEKARQILQANPLPWRNWLDTATSGPNTTLYNIHHFPTLFLIDTQGIIVMKNPSLDSVAGYLQKQPTAPQK